MDFVRLERRLERAFTGRPVQVGAGSIVWRRKPVALWQLVAASLDKEERAEETDLQAWPGSVAELLGARGRSLLGFYWDGFGPTSFVAGLTLLELDRSSYLCHWDELESYRAVAKLEGWRKRSVLRDTVGELLRENGHPHGLSVFGSLPTETTNYAVRLIPTATVKQAYFDWLQADPWGNGDTWSELAQEHYSRLVEPNVLTRSLDYLSTFPALDDSEAVNAWLKQEEDESAAMPDHSRQRLFDDWFATAYEQGVS